MALVVHALASLSSVVDCPFIARQKHNRAQQQSSKQCYYRHFCLTKYHDFIYVIEHPLVVRLTLDVGKPIIVGIHIEGIVRALTLKTYISRGTNACAPSLVCECRQIFSRFVNKKPDAPQQ